MLLLDIFIKMNPSPPYLSMMCESVSNKYYQGVTRFQLLKSEQPQKTKKYRKLTAEKDLEIQQVCPLRFLLFSF